MLRGNICVIFILMLSCLAVAINFPSKFDRISTSISGDTDIFVGDDLQLKCKPTDEQLKTYTVSGISFSVLYPFKGSHLECLPMSLVHVSEDRQSASLILPNVTVDNAGQYTCHIGHRPCIQSQDAEQLETVGSDDVFVEYPPHNVIHFVCVVYNWNDSMNCTWQHPVDYINWSNINVSVGYIAVTSKTEQVKAYRCPHLSSKSCTFNKGTFYLVDNYLLEVNITNMSKKITASKIFPVNISQAVKPAPVASLSSKTSQDMPGCVMLSWKHSSHFNKTYRVQHQTVGNSTFKVVTDNITNTNITCCGYHSHTHHNFSVDCYPIDEYSGYRSEPVYTDAWTPMTAPNVGPRTINGSYTSTKCDHGYRNVTLMWQEIEESERNGIIDGYYIKQGGKYVKNVTAGNLSTNVELSCGVSSSLTIYAHTQGGYSVQPTVMVISPETVTVPTSIIKSFAVNISYNENTVSKESLRAVWNTSEDVDHVNYVVFWCLGLLGKSCEGPIHWSEVPGTHTYYDFPLLPAAAQKYLFGISTIDTQADRATGIFWTGCLFQHHPAHVPSVQMQVESGTECVRVTWNQIECSYQNPVKVTDYRVKWCEEPSCNASIFTADVPATESSYLVSPLTAHGSYKFTVQPVANGITGDEVQPWQTANPSAAAFQSLMWLLSIIIIIIIVLPLMVYAYRKCLSRQKYVQRMRNNTPFDFPATVEDIAVPELRSVNPTEHLEHLGEAATAGIDQELSDSECPLVSSRPNIFSETTSGSSCLDEPSANSRTHLITSTQDKVIQWQKCRQDHEAIALGNLCVSPEGASSQNMSEHAGVGETNPTHGESCDYVRQNEWTSTAVTTTPHTESVQPYVQLTTTSVTNQKELHVREPTDTPCPAQIHPQSEHIVLRVEQGNEAASTSVEEYSNITIQHSLGNDGIQDTLNPDDTVTSVQPAAPSVIGAGNEVVALERIGKEESSSDMALSDFSVNFCESSGQTDSHSRSGRSSYTADYVPHTNI